MTRVVGLSRGLAFGVVVSIAIALGAALVVTPTTVTVKNTGCGSLAHEILHAADFARTTTSVTCGIRTIDNPTVSSGCARKRGPHQWDLAVIRIIPGEKGVIGRPASLLCVIGTLTTLTLAGPFRGRFELPHGIDVRPATRRARVVAQSPSSSSQHEKRRDNGNGGAVMTYGTAGAPRRARRWCVWAPVILAVGALLGGGASARFLGFRNPSLAPGVVAASAMREVFGMAADGAEFEKVMETRRWGAPEIAHAAGQEPHDPFIPWLATKLLRHAAMGTLFVRDGDRINLRITWDMGDRSRWYIGRVSTIPRERAAVEVSGPWIFWRSVGALVTPSSPEDKPSIEDYPLDGVRPGDIVQFDLFRAPRDLTRSPGHLDPTMLVERNEAELILRLHLPVIVDSR